MNITTYKSDYYVGLDSTETKFVAVSSNKPITIGVSKETIDNIFNINKFNAIKEDFYAIGINNLIKKNNLLQLSLQLSDELITEEEFEYETENNTEKYIISTKGLNSTNDLLALNEIVKKIGRDFTVDQITEIFSVSFKNIKSLLKL